MRDVNSLTLSSVCTNSTPQVKTVEFWYLRSWLLADIEFLTKYAEPGQTVVISATPRLTYLQALVTQYFPELEFIVYCERMGPMALPNADVRLRTLQPAEARDFLGKQYLFIGHDIITSGGQGRLGTEMLRHKVRGWSLR